MCCVMLIWYVLLFSSPQHPDQFLGQTSLLFLGQSLSWPVMLDSNSGLLEEKLGVLILQARLLANMELFMGTLFWNLN
jgi:hypothetical protein